MQHLSETIRSIHGQDGGIVLDIQQGQIFNLNPVGSRIIELLKTGAAESAMVDDISQKFEVKRDVAESDLREFVETLTRHHLLRVADRPVFCRIGTEIVKSQLQPERTPCGVIVLSRDGTEVLLKITEAGFAFPHVDIQRSVRVAENLTAALKTTWACDAVCLFSATALSSSVGSNRNRYEVMDCWDCERRVDGTAWKPITSPKQKLLPEPNQYVVPERSLHQLDDYEHNPSSPFAQRGWLARLLQWASCRSLPFGSRTHREVSSVQC